jgi:hypothetical protein
VGDLELEDHDGDEDGDDAVAEGFEAGFSHGVGVSFCVRGRARARACVVR